MKERWAVMVCGSASHVGKSLIVSGLCRVLADAGMAVAPFKAQNMALNSTVTGEGREIGRAQALQAAAARVEPEAAMNPILLKPNDDRTSQVLVRGRPWATLDAVGYHAAKDRLLPTVLETLEDLRARFDMVVLEGAGSPAEINLLDHDLVNLGLARRADIKAVVVGDIDRGGVFAHLYGTVALLPQELRVAVGGFIINKFRGDPSLLGSAIDELRARSGVPTLGVLPWLEGLSIDAEDSLSLGTPSMDTEAMEEATEPLEVAVVALPRMSNFTDFDPLRLEPGVALRFVRHPSALARADLVVLPGTKDTSGDLTWLHRSGIAEVLRRRVGAHGGPVLLGLCGGFQMMGRLVEEPPRPLEGLGFLDAVATHDDEKVLERRRGCHLESGASVSGYLIHHNRVKVGPRHRAMFHLDGAPEGVADVERGLFATSLHGLFEADQFRSAFLAEVAWRADKAVAPSPLRFAEAREAQIERVASACRTHLDLEAVLSLAAGVGQ